MKIEIDIEKRIKELKSKTNKKEYGLFIIEIIKEAVINKSMSYKEGEVFLYEIDSIINPKINNNFIFGRKIFKRYLKEIKSFKYENKVNTLALLANAIMEAIENKKINEESGYENLKKIFDIVPYKELQSKLKYRIDA